MHKGNGQEIIKLYCLMGEALCMIQHLEDALSHSITIKKDVKPPNSMLREEANRILEKHRSYTFGQAVKLAGKEKLYADTLQHDLSVILRERNWLIHKCIDDLYSSNDKERLLPRLKNLSRNAVRIKQDIELDLIAFSESRGMDMSGLRSAIDDSPKMFLFDLNDN